MPRPRVLVVEDDAATRRFVALALEDLDLTLMFAGSVPEALALLATDGPVNLLITDLMLPGASGVDLLQTLAETPALRGGARLVVFSAGLDPTKLERLRALGVWRSLAKPVALAQLVDCVVAALDGPPPADASLTNGTAEGAHADRQAARPANALLPAAQAEALALHFGGDLGLFLAYHASCVQQFSIDASQGDADVARRDATSLCRLAHSLKSVLATLGYGATARIARSLEDACAADDWSTALPQWVCLRAALGQMKQLPPVDNGEIDKNAE